MARATDLKVFSAGSSHSLIGQQMYASGAYRTLKGGTAVYKNGQWYIYYEALNAQVSLAVTSATQIDFTFQSLPSEPFRPEGLYLINKNTLEVRLRFSGQMRFTDDSRDAYQYTTDPLPCDGVQHTLSDTTSVPSGKELYQVDIDAVEVLFSSEGMDGWAYIQGDVPVETTPRRFKAYAAVSPIGSGYASATPSDPLYGQIVTFTATDGNGYKFTRWASGRTSRSYAIQAFGDLSDTAVFESTANVVDFIFELSIDADGHLQVVGKSLQNKMDAFVMVAFNIKYLDNMGAEQTARYEREIYINGQEDTYVFSDTNVSEILEYTTPEFTGMPAPYVTGDVQVIITSAYTSQSLDAGPDDPGPGDSGGTDVTTN